MKTKECNARASTIQGNGPLTVLHGVRESPHSHSPKRKKLETENLKQAKTSSRRSARIASSPDS